MFSSQQTSHLLRSLQSGHSVVITTHRNPDADALGSSLGLFHILKRISNSPIRIMVPDAFPAFLDWMPGADTIAVYEKDEDQGKGMLQSAGLIFCLDYNHPSRTGPMEEALRQSPAPKVMIDHHQQPDSFAAYIWSDTTASSTCELIVRFMDLLGTPGLLNREIATCLYTGIMTDTGSFRFAATSAQTHLVIARLMETGIEHWKIHEAIFNQNTLEKLRLWGHALGSRLYSIPELRTAYIWLSEAELQEYGYRDGDLEGLVNYALSIRGTVMGVLFTERKGRVRISFRSVGNFSVNRFAREHFNGGGHENAAGGTSEDTLEATVQRFLKVLPGYAAELTAP